MIEVCYIIGQLGKGGAERQLYELIKGLNKKRFAPVVISLSQGGLWKDEIQRLDVQVIELQRRKNWEFARLFRLYRLLKAMTPDIVHTFLFSANTYGRIAAILTTVPVIIASERNSVEAGKDKNRLWIYIDKFLARFTHGIICNTRNAAESLVNKHAFSANKVFAVHNGITAASFKMKNWLDHKEYSATKVVGTIGRLYPQKNHSLFLRMAKLISEKRGHEDVKFIIVGEGPLKNELKKHALELGIESRVEFAGMIDNVQDILYSMDVFVLSSDWEGLPNVVMEAMASGLPCVVTNVGGNPELVVDGETGYVVPTNGLEAMAQKVLCLLENEGLARNMGERGRKLMEEDFKMEKMIRKTEEIYERLMTGKLG